MQFQENKLKGLTQFIDVQTIIMTCQSPEKTEFHGLKILNTFFYIMIKFQHYARKI